MYHRYGRHWVPLYSLPPPPVSLRSQPLAPGRPLCYAQSARPFPPLCPLSGRHRRRLLSVPPALAVTLDRQVWPVPVLDLTCVCMSVCGGYAVAGRLVRHVTPERPPLTCIGIVSDPGYMSKQIWKFRADKFDT